MGDCGNCDNTECCDNCGGSKVPEISERDKEKALFLTTLGVVLERHNMTWRDVNVNWVAGEIDIRFDASEPEIMSFLVDLHKTTGGFE